jgi:acyl-CoA thioester hydrolase
MIAAPIASFSGVAHPWMCDTMGHMNVRFYAAMFDDASFHLLGRVSDPRTDIAARLGWADVRCEIDYEHETEVGTLLSVHSHLEKVGRTSIVYVHAMSDALKDTVHVRARIVSVRLDLAARQKVELDPTTRDRAEALMLQAGPVEGSP